MDQLSRNEARAAGLKVYQLGRPCRHGHTCGRYVSNQQCVDCAKAMERKLRGDPGYRARGTARRRAWRQANPEKAREYERRKVAANPEKYREINRRAVRKFHGYPEPTRPAPPACELCGEPCSKSLALDHDHVTGAFRGWLCQKCNRGLGLFRDRIELLERAIAYLKRASGSDGQLRSEIPG